jgi:type III pantothenate kinase
MVPVLLVLDVANRQTTVALLDGERVVHDWRVATEPNWTADDHGLRLDRLIARAGVEPGALVGAIVGSVVPTLTGTLAAACRRFLNVEPAIVGPGVRTGLRIRTDNPRELGPDRVANALAAIQYHGRPAIVVDFGTVIAFDVINAAGDYAGTVIAPGLEMSVEALATMSAQLRGVEVAQPGRVIGTSTVAATQSGVVNGLSALVDGLCQRITAELDAPAVVVATGHHADLVKANCRAIDVVDPHLTLTGLRLIWELNQHPAEGGSLA